MRLPRTMPEPTMSPPRTSGWLGVKRRKTSPGDRAGRSVSASVFRRVLPQSGARNCGQNRLAALYGSQRGIVIRMIADFLHILRVLNFIVRRDHEDRPALDAQFLDQRAIV